MDSTIITVVAFVLALGLGALAMWLLGQMGDAAVVEKRREKRRLRTLSPRCGNCRHFDLEAGQFGLADHGPFGQVMGSVSPARLYNKRLYYQDEPDKIDDPDNPGEMIDNPKWGAELPESEQPEPLFPLDSRWDEFGLCRRDEQVVIGRQEAAKCPFDKHGERYALPESEQQRDRGSSWKMI